MLPLEIERAITTAVKNIEVSRRLIDSMYARHKLNLAEIVAKKLVDEFFVTGGLIDAEEFIDEFSKAANAHLKSLGSDR